MFILPTPEAVQELMGRLPEEPFVMLNLYRLRNVADYSAHPEIAPESPVSGRELFDRYAAGMDRLLAELGAKRVFLAEGGSPFIGPSAERWDVVQLVWYPPPRRSWLWPPTMRCKRVSPIASRCWRTPG